MLERREEFHLKEEHVDVYVNQQEPRMALLNHQTTIVRLTFGSQKAMTQEQKENILY